MGWQAGDSTGVGAVMAEGVAWEERMVARTAAVTAVTWEEMMVVHAAAMMAAHLDAMRHIQSSLGSCRIDSTSGSIKWDCWRTTTCMVVEEWAEGSRVEEVLQVDGVVTQEGALRGVVEEYTEAVALEDAQDWGVARMVMGHMEAEVLTVVSVKAEARVAASEEAKGAGGR